MTERHAKDGDPLAEPPTSAAPTARRARWALIALLLLTGAVYARSVAGGFVWDDRGLIVDNRYVQDWRYLRRNLTSRFWDTSNARPRWKQRHYYRPLVTLSYQLDYALWGPRAAGFHLTNVALHLLVVWLAWLLCRRLAPGRLLVAVVGAGLFALHPTRAESVAWISGRTDVLLALFTLGALLCFERALAARGRALVGWLALAWAAWLGALGSKESAVALVLLLPALDWLCRRSPAELVRRNWALVHLPLVPVGLVFVATVLSREGAAGAGGLGARLAALLASTSYYLELALSPYQPSALIGLHLDLGAAPAWRLILGAATIIAVLAGIVRWRRRRPLVAWGLVFCAVTLAPALNLFPLAGTLIAERFTYLPLLGLTLALGAALGRARLAPRMRSFALAVLALLAATWAAVVVLRAADFDSELAFWRAELAAHPEHPTANEELAKRLARRGRAAQAARYLARAQRYARARKLPAVVQSLSFARMAALGDRLADVELSALRSLAALAERVATTAGAQGEALTIGGERFTLTPADVQALRRHFGAELLQLAGKLRSRVGDDARALALLKRSVKAAPRRAQASVELGVARGRAGELAAAQRALARAAKLAPGDRRVRALQHVLKRLVEASGAGQDARVATTQRLLALGAPGRAARLLDTLVAERPGQRALWSSLVLARAAAGDKAGVRRALRRARARFGNEPGLARLAQQAQQSYGRLVQRLGREP